MSTQGDDQSWVARELRSPHVPKVLSFVRPQLAGG